MPETIAGQVERASAALDRLFYDLRLNPHPSERPYIAFEDRAQTISGAIVVPFRGKQPPVAAPLHMHIIAAHTPDIHAVSAPRRAKVTALLEQA